MQLLRKILDKRTVNSPVGLDIGQAAARVAQLQRSGDRWSIALLGTWRLPRESLYTITSSWIENADFLHQVAHWLRKTTFYNRKTVAGLSFPDVELHPMELPQIPNSGGGEQQRQAAHWEIERLMNFDEGSAETDYWLLPESRTMTSTAIGVAAPKNILNEINDLSRLGQLDCIKVDATSCALARFGCLLRDPDETDNDVWAVLDSGSRMARLIICVGEIPVLARAFHCGGTSWSMKLAASLSVSNDTAEQHKKDHGIAPITRKQQDNQETPNILSEMVYNVLRDDLENIISELERSYRYVLNCFPQRQPGPLILTGGGANLKNLDELLSSRLGIKTIIPTTETNNINQRIDLSNTGQLTREPIANFAGAIGLAITV